MTELEAAVERVTADLAAAFGSYAGEPDGTLALVRIADAEAVLSAFAQAQDSLDEHALFDAETDLAFKDLDAEIADLKESLATSEARRGELELQLEASEARERALTRGLQAIAKPEYGLGFRGLKGIARRALEFVQSKTSLNPQQEGSRDHG